MEASIPNRLTLILQRRRLPLMVFFEGARAHASLSVEAEKIEVERVLEEIDQTFHCDRKNAFIQ